MSLLMDALRKAEEAKRAAAQSESNPTRVNPTNPAVSVTSQTHSDHTEELSLEPMPGIAGTPAPASSERNHPKVETDPPRLSNKPTEQAQRSSAQNMFAAKKPPKKSHDRLFILALASVAGLAIIGIGAYVWWQLQPRSGVGAIQQPVAQPQPTQALPHPPSVASMPQTPLPPAPADTPKAAPVFTAPEPREARPYAPPRTAERAPEASPIRVTHQTSRINPLLEQGYNALQQGNLPQAQQAYERMLASDPKNLDALYGLAAIAVSRQQNSLAENYYLRILEVDPRDALAHAGLTSLSGRAGGNAESRLKTLIAEQPNVAALHFALGNIYAQDQRWRDAQQAYFLAYKNDSEAPDIAFNLAISLDQLHQDKLAAQYYGEALRLTANHPGTFNRIQAQTRLRELRGVLPP